MQTNSDGVVRLSRLHQQQQQQVTAVRIECLVAAQRVQQAAERLLLPSKMWPPPPPPGAASAASPVRSEPADRARRELSNLRLLADQMRRRLLAGGAGAGAGAGAAAVGIAEDGSFGDVGFGDSEEALVDCGRRLQVTCVQCIEAVYRAVYTSLSQQQQQQLQPSDATNGQQLHQQQQQPLLNRLAVGRACDGLLASANGLDLAVSVAAAAATAAAAAASVTQGSGRRRSSAVSIDDGALGRLSDQLSQSLADLSRAGRPARLGGDPADAEALQLSVRCAAAAGAQLLHAVRCVRSALGSGASAAPAGPTSVAGGLSTADDAAVSDLQSRVRLAADGLRPAVNTVLAVAGETRFSGRPLRLSEEAKAGRARALGHALPVALATVELLTAMGGGQGGQQQRLPQLAEALQTACGDCLAKMQPLGGNG